MPSPDLGYLVSREEHEKAFGGIMHDLRFLRSKQGEGVEIAGAIGPSIRNVLQCLTRQVRTMSIKKTNRFLSPSFREMVKIHGVQTEGM